MGLLKLWKMLANKILLSPIRKNIKSPKALPSFEFKHGAFRVLRSKFRVRSGEFGAEGAKPRKGKGLGLDFGLWVAGLEY